MLCYVAYLKLAVLGHNREALSAVVIVILCGQLKTIPHTCHDISGFDIRGLDIRVLRINRGLSDKCVGYRLQNLSVCRILVLRLTVEILTDMIRQKMFCLFSGRKLLRQTII